MKPSELIRVAFAVATLTCGLNKIAAAAPCTPPVGSEDSGAQLEYANCLLANDFDVENAAAIYQQVASSDATPEYRTFARNQTNYMRRVLATLVNNTTVLNAENEVVSIKLKRDTKDSLEREIKERDLKNPISLIAGTYNIEVHRRDGSSFSTEMCLGAGNRYNVDEFVPKPQPRLPIQLACNDLQCHDKCEWTQEHVRERYSQLLPVIALQPSNAEPGFREVQHAVGIAVGVAGLVSAGVGTGFAIAAQSKESNSNRNCGAAAGFQDPNACNAEGLALNRGAQTYRTASIWTIGLGAMATVAGIITYFSAPLSTKRNESPTPNSTSGAVSVVPSVGREQSGLWLQTAW